MSRFVVGFLLSTLSLISALIGVYKFVLTNIAPISSDATAGVIFLGALSFLFYVNLVYSKAKSDRQVRYGETLSVVNEAFSKIYDIQRDTERLSLHSIIPVLETVCKNLEQVFSTITATSCHVAVKIINSSDKERLRVRTLCRSSSGRSYDEDKIDHWIDKNTDFYYLFENLGKQSGKYFISNKLPFLHDYQNTSFADYGKPSDSMVPFLRLWRWPLPYKSTIVVPICSGKLREKDLIGFLCVDSKSLGAFKKDYDIDLLQGVSASLFNLMSLTIVGNIKSDGKQPLEGK